ncbi:hypothetical protein [Tolypothrix sp. VBCCA 56010]|uniref:hypothetical protein n=1 Tax=Tolypothrix sp. VBCCA 56010 TaxID=3137731 RepID=UPI003D7DA8D5
MKRKISLVIAFALSFLLMFSSIARAEETKFKTVTTCESIQVEAAKIPRDTNKANSTSQENVKVPFLDMEATTSIWNVCVQCPDGGWGYWRYIGNNNYHCFAVCKIAQ